MPYYRVSRNDYEVGDSIYPDAQYIQFIKDPFLKAEQVLEEARPENKPDRNATVKLFDSLDAARRYWVLDANAKIYQVEAAPEDIKHRGNYSMYRDIVQAEGDEQLRLAELYWQDMDEGAEDIIIENYVDHTVVAAIICADERLRKNTLHYLKSNTCIPGLGVLDEDGQIVFPDIERDIE